MITFILPAEHEESDGLDPHQQLLKLGKDRTGIGIHDGLYPSIMAETQPPVQTHFI